MCLGTMDNLGDSSVHIDLLKRLSQEHETWLICKHEGKPTELTEEYGIHVLRVHTGELKKVDLIRKGINTLLVEPQFTFAMKRYLSDFRFDLVLYTTPPITFANAVEYIKNRDKATTYLLLKDIFPQNAIDLGMMGTEGLKGLLYRHFRKKEKQLYNLSDYIGCMSPANVRYIVKNNPEIDPGKVEECPNVTVIRDQSLDETTKKKIREKYEIPQDKTIFVYGGNLGKPQDIPFLIQCLKTQHNQEAFFLVVGQGTEYGKMESFINHEAPDNCRLLANLPTEEYEQLVAACDVGMIFLDHRFTIPNFPSRILSYMKAKIPVLAVTDPNTDMGEIIVGEDFGWWCESNDANRFSEMIKEIVKADLKAKGLNGWEYLKQHYSVDNAYRIIMEKIG